MKVSIFAIILGSFLVISCSKDNAKAVSSSSSANYDYSGSKITVNKVKYVPTVVSVIDQKTSDIKRKKRTFFLASDKTKQSFSVQFNFPTAQTKIDGIYSTDTTAVNYAWTTYYEDARFVFNATKGKVKITDLGEGQYGIEFLEVEVYNPTYVAPSTTPIVTTPKDTLSNGTKTNARNIVAFTTESPVTTTTDTTVVDPKKRYINGLLIAKFDKNK